LEIRPLNPNNAEQVKALLLEHCDHLPYAGCFASWNLALWLYSLLILTVGAGQGKLPIIHALEEDGAVIGASVLVRDDVLRHRWQIEQLVLNPKSDHMTELGIFLITYLISTYGAKGGKTFLAYVNDRYTDALDLLKACSFHQAMTRESHLVTLTPQETPNSCPLLYNEWKRLTPHYYGLMSEHFNNQIPPLWRHALERLPEHFRDDTQRQGLPLERWWLPMTALPDIAEHSGHHQGCALYIEMVCPSTQGSIQSPHWQVSVFPAPNLELPVEHCIQAIVNYCHRHAPEAPIELSTWSYQTTIRPALQPFVKQGVLSRTSLLVRDCKTRTPKGMNTRIQKAIALMDKASGGGAASPA